MKDESFVVYCDKCNLVSKKSYKSIPGAERSRMWNEHLTGCGSVEIIRGDVFLKRMDGRKPDAKPRSV